MADPTLISSAPPAGPTLGAAPANPGTVDPSASPFAPQAAPTASPEPAAAPAPAPDAPKAEDTKPSEPQTLLGDAPKVEPVPTADGAKAPEAKADAPKDGEKISLDDGVKSEEVSQDGSKSDEPAPLPAYDAFELPEGVTLDPERLGTFTKYLGEFEVDTKADHAKVHALGQKLATEFVGEIQQAVDRVGETYRTLWEKQKTDWRDDFMKDPDLGGNRSQTTIDAANKFIRMHGGSEAEQAELRQILEQSGLGNHKVLIRTFAKAGNAMGEGRQLAAPKPAPKELSKVERMYGSNR